MNAYRLTVVLGASSKPERYAFMAIEKLLEAGISVIPVSPKGGEVLGMEVLPDLGAVRALDEPVETVTLYVGADRLRPLVDDLIALKPRRVIFNPGTEDAAIEKQLVDAGIRVTQGCTLVLLSTDQY